MVSVQNIQMCNKIASSVNDVFAWLSCCGGTSRELLLFSFPCFIVFSLLCPRMGSQDVIILPGQSWAASSGDLGVPRALNNAATASSVNNFQGVI